MLLELAHNHHNEVMLFLCTVYFLAIALLIVLIGRAIKPDSEFLNGSDDRYEEEKWLYAHSEYTTGLSGSF